MQQRKQERTMREEGTFIKSLHQVSLPMKLSQTSLSSPSILFHAVAPSRKQGRPSVRKSQIVAGSQPIFDLDMILIPHHYWIHERSKIGHWVLVSVHMKKKTINYYDSLRTRGRGQRELQAVLDWLQEEAAAKDEYFQRSTWSTSIALIDPSSRGSEQTNGYDCGLWTIM
jgi:hypothetical protein